jgi:hypothetical protein
MWTKVIRLSRAARHLTRDVEVGRRWGPSYADLRQLQDSMALGHVPSLHNLLYDARIPGFEFEFLA